MIAVSQVGPTTAELDEYYNVLIAAEDDYRFEIIRVEEPDFIDRQYLVRRIHIGTDAIVESNYTADPGAEIAAFRETQGATFEERFAEFGPEWEREQVERAGL